MEHDVVIITSRNKVRLSRVRFTRAQVLAAARRVKIVEEAKKQMALGNYIS